MGLLSPLTAEDESLFRKFVKKYRAEDNCDFKDSWAYILQATRNNPQKFARDDALFLLAQIDDGFVIPNYFVSHENVLLDFVLNLKKRVILKNVAVADIEKLCSLGFRKYKDNETWFSFNKPLSGYYRQVYKPLSDYFEQLPFDDQSYPQRIVNISDLLLLKGSDYALLRKNLKAIAKENYDGSTLNMQNLSVRGYNPVIDKKAVLFLSEDSEIAPPGFTESIERYLDLSSSPDFHAFVFCYPHKYRVQYQSDIIGYVAFDSISSVCCAYNAMVHFSDAYPYLSSLLTFETAKIAQHLGFEFMNLQGSQTVSLDRWKIKFGFFQSIEKTHLVFDGVTSKIP